MEGDAATPDAAAEAAPSVDVEPDASEPAVQIPQNERGQRREKTIARLEANIAKAEADERGEEYVKPADPILDADNADPYKVSREALEALPDDAKKLVANLRAMTTRKTQELAAEKKRLQSEREALTSPEYISKLKEAAEAEVGFDPFDPESVQAHIAKEVAAALGSALEPVRQEVQLSNRRAALERFKGENPAINDPAVKSKVAALLQADENLRLEQAFFIVQGQTSSTEAETLRAELTRLRSEAKNLGMKIGGANRGTGSGRVPAGVRAQGAVAIMEWFQANGTQ